MKITDVKIRKNTNEGVIKGVAAVTLDDCFVIHNIKIIEGDNELFIAMPSKRNNEGKFQDIVHPINTETRALFTEAIVNAYVAIN